MRGDILFTIYNLLFTIWLRDVTLYERLWYLQLSTFNFYSRTEMICEKYGVTYFSSSGEEGK